MADPLFRTVTPEGERLLARPDNLLPSPWLDEWKQQGRTRLYLWPHGPLHYLPLHLYTHEGRPLAEAFTFTTIPSPSVLAPALATAARPPHTTVLASATGGEQFGLAREDPLEEHAREVAEHLGAAAIVGSEATRERLLRELAVADVIHIAAHGSQDLAAPWSHCLYLSETEDDDGRVFAYDILSTDLRGVRLVTLASCESGLGRFDVNDNLRGLPAALLLAGAQAIVACLWPVDPDPATLFFATLHRHIAGGAAIEPAFRQSQQYTRECFPQYRHWGSFVVIGGSGVYRGGSTQ
jgi:CHAT domain-containing protein